MQKPLETVFGKIRDVLSLGHKRPPGLGAAEKMGLDKWEANTIKWGACRV